MTFRRTWSAAALATAGAALGAPPALAQDTTTTPAVVRDTARASGAPYGRVTIAVSGAQPVAEGALSTWWDAGRGVRVDVHVPFYVGDAGLWLMRLPYAARADAQPDFDAWAIALEWRVTPFASSRLRPHLAVSAGNFLTTFEGIDTKGLSKESEIFVGASGGLAVRVAGATSLTAGVTALQVLTSTPIRVGIATLGVAHTMRTPGWLRGVIE